MSEVPGLCNDNILVFTDSTATDMKCRAMIRWSNVRAIPEPGTIFDATIIAYPVGVRDIPRH